MSIDFITFDFMFFDSISFYFMSFYFMSFDSMSYDSMSFDSMPFPSMSFEPIFFSSMSIDMEYANILFLSSLSIQYLNQYINFYSMTIFLIQSLSLWPIFDSLVNFWFLGQFLIPWSIFDSMLTKRFFISKFNYMF